MSQKTLLLIVVVVVVAVAVWIGIWVSREPQGADASPYSAVYLTSGDIYFGRLSWFPWPRLTKVWYVQRTVNQQNQPQLGLIPFTSTLWAPIDEVYLNPREVLFWTYLRNDSQVAKALANPASVPPAQAPPAPPALSPATSTGGTQPQPKR